MKKILSLVLAVVMIMAMAIPAFAATENEVAPCATCNGNHTYDEASVDVTYANSIRGCIKTVVRHYKCRYCSSAYTAAPETYTLNHKYVLKSATCDTKTQTHNYRCSNCKDWESEYHACPGAGHTSGHCSWLPI